MGEALMARTSSSVTYYCANDCGSELTVRRDDFLPATPWICPCCVLADLANDLDDQAKADELHRMAKYIAYINPKPTIN